MACVPPYSLGTGVGCGCNCKCCPPDPCYTSWTYTYLCGTSSSSWTTPPPPNTGCVCESVPPTFRAPGLDIAFPEFDYPSMLKNEGGFVFALNDTGPPSCSIPCVTVTITVTTSGCCLYGSDFSFGAVGAGTVSVTTSGGPCGSFEVSINGSGNSVTVDDGESISISITTPAAECCSCCLVGSSGALLSSGGTQTFRLRNTSNGLSRLIRKSKRYS